MCQEQINAVSPEAASLIKMNNFQINLNTGIPEIMIPLYEINAKELKLPINLQYHSGGFKINEHSQRTGLGWSISSEILITREINGLDDFKPFGGYLANNLIKSMDTTITDNKFYPIYGSNFWRNSYDLAAGIKDGSPDKFHYKLLNKSGSFYFLKNSSGNGYSIVPVPFDDIKITFNQGLFTIIDSDGTIYYFGTSIGPNGHHHDNRNDTGFEYTANSPTMSITSWRCKKIINHSNTSEINFTYVKKEPDHFKSYQDKIELFYNENQPHEFHFLSREPPLNNATTYEHVLLLVDFWTISSPKYIEYLGTKATLHVPYLEFGNINNNVYEKQYPKTSSSNSGYSLYALSLSEINYEGGNILFHGIEKLDSIIVSSSKTRVKKIHFLSTYTPPIYTYWAKIMNGDKYEGTLYLDGINFLDNANSVVENYSFEYNYKQSFGNHLRGHDLWGFRNLSTENINEYNTISSIPDQNLSLRYYFDQINYVNNINFKIGGLWEAEFPDLNETKRGVLKKITFPTKGSVIYNYELNKYLYSNVTLDAGGLRVESIDYYKSNAVTPHKRQIFRYGEYESGAGHIVNQPITTHGSMGEIQYSGYKFSQNIFYLTGPNDVPGNGTPPFYPIGISCYNRNCLYPIANELKTTYLPSSFLDFNFSNGSPIYYTHVNEYLVEGTEKLGKTENIFYNPLHFYDMNVSHWPSGIIEGTTMKRLKTQGFMGKLKSKSVYKDSLGFYKLVNRTEYNYRRYLRPEMVRVIYSFFKVNLSIVGGNFNGNPEDIYDENYQLGVGLTPTDYYIKGEYGIAVGNLLLTHIKETNYDGQNPIIKIVEYSYNNPLYLQPSTKTTVNSVGDRFVTYYKYSYDFIEPVYQDMTSKNILTPIIDEFVLKESNLQLIERNKVNWENFFINSSLNFLAPFLIEKEYTNTTLVPIISYDLYDKYAKPIQITQRVKNNGIPTVYLWGYSSQYPIAKIVNATYAEVKNFLGDSTINSINSLLVSEEIIRNTINTLRTNANFKKSQVWSYTYSPLVGMTSMTDPRGVTEYYKFDGFQRLKNVLDFDSNVLKEYQYHYRPNY